MIALSAVDHGFVPSQLSILLQWLSKVIVSFISVKFLLKRFSPWTCMKYMYMYMLLDIDKTTNCNDQSVCMFFKLNTVKSLLFVGGGTNFRGFRGYIGWSTELRIQRIQPFIIFYLWLKPLVVVSQDQSWPQGKCTVKFYLI
jgi:hypothetical protein